MRIIAPAKAKKNTFYISLLAFSISAANAQDDSLSLQGYSGLLNIPNAHVTTHGTGFIQYSDQMFRDGEYVHNNNLSGSFGIFPNVEVGGRIAWFHSKSNLYTDEREPRDLSANIKVKIPFIPDNWFSIALGEQDVGGEANFFDAKYAVISRSFGPIRIDAGYGDSIENGRLDGAFGGFEYQAFPWLSLIGEYDARDVNAGFRLNTPASWMPNGFRADLTVMAYSDNELSDDKRFFGLAFRFPLNGDSLKPKSKPVKRNPIAANQSNTPTYSNGYQKTKTAPLPLQYAANRYRKRTTPTSTIIDYQPSEANPSHTKIADSNGPQNSIAKKLFQQLQQHEFERIKTGIDAEGVLNISIENTIFNHNELDAIGLTLGIAANLAKEEIDKTRLFLTNEGIQVLEITISNKQFAEYTNNPGILNADITVKYPSDTSIEWHHQSAPDSHHKPVLTLSPTITNVIANENGVYNYSWGLESTASLSLWKGAIASISLNQELVSSENFEKGGVFYKSRERDEVKNMTLQQTVKYKSLFNTTYVGRRQYDYNGFQNLTTLLSPSGVHKATARFGDYTHDSTDKSKDFALYSYRYYSQRFNASTEITSGKFWEGDNGYRVESKFWFGDNAVSLIYKDTDQEFIAITWNLPLSPRKDFNSSWGQVKGNTDWTYGIQTMINNDSNDIAFGAGIVPKMTFETEQTYLNRDRLSPAYVYGNLLRLREAYLQYK